MNTASFTSARARHKRSPNTRPKNARCDDARSYQPIRKCFTFDYSNARLANGRRLQHDPNSPTDIQNARRPAADNLRRLLRANILRLFEVLLFSYEGCRMVKSHTEMKRSSQLKRTPMNRGKSVLKRGRLAPRRYSKTLTVDGDSARSIKDECDNLMRTIVALRDVSCITCNRVETSQVGHLFRRGIESVRWNLLNCNRQCTRCNGLHETEPLHYEVAFKFRYSVPAYHALEVASRSPHKFTYIELISIRDELRREAGKAIE